MRHALVFVYNADSGLFNTVADIAHKILSPDTYACQLCALTHDHFAVRKEWREFLQGLDADYEFLHRDELASRYGIQDVELPAIFQRQADGLEIWIDAASLRACASLDALKALLTQKLSGDKA
ncbi:MAG: hypothetical protein LC646_08580 [Xanthomonadaceae bacterium]|nr:hypothetical protein [Xanthomonadaceae bacterium]